MHCGYWISFETNDNQARFKVILYIIYVPSLFVELGSGMCHSTFQF